MPTYRNVTGNTIDVLGKHILPNGTIEVCGVFSEPGFTIISDSPYGIELDCVTNSEIVPVSDGSIVVLLNNVQRTKPRNIVTVKFFSSESEADSVIPTGGSIAVSAKLIGAPVFEETYNGTYAAPDLQSSSFYGNAEEVRVVVADIVGATHFKVHLTQNKE